MRTSGVPMPSTPRERTLGSSLALLGEGYTFIGTRSERFQSDIFSTRLMLQKDEIGEQYAT